MLNKLSNIYVCIVMHFCIQVYIIYIYIYTYNIRYTCTCMHIHVYIYIYIYTLYIYLYIAYIYSNLYMFNACMCTYIHIIYTHFGGGPTMFNFDFSNLTQKTLTVASSFDLCQSPDTTWCLCLDVCYMFGADFASILLFQFKVT